MRYLIRYRNLSHISYKYHYMYAAFLIFNEFILMREMTEYYFFFIPRLINIFLFLFLYCKWKNN